MRPTPGSAGRLRELTTEFRVLAERLRAGGGTKRIERMHQRGQLSPRERVDALLDPGAPWFEIGLLVAWDRYDGKAPAAGVITGVGVVEGREVVVVANDSTVKAGAWWPETITKILRAQEVAMRERIPIIYLVDSAGVNLPYQDGVFPGQYGAARIFYYNSLMRRFLRVPQFAAVMGSCIAGGAYLPALSDVIFMVEGTSFMGLGGPNLVQGATGQKVEREELGGASTHTGISGVAHYMASDDADCLRRIRAHVARLPRTECGQQVESYQPPKRDPTELYEVLPDDHRLSYDMTQVLDSILDGGEFDEFQAERAGEMLCGHGLIQGRSVAVIANKRGLVPRDGQPPRLGGIVYAESAEKVAYFIETADRQGTPILFVQDVSGFMVGLEAEHAGIIRAGAHLVEAMATTRVPKIVLTINHASGAGYYAMAGQGFDPDFIISWPTGRMAVMEGESAVMAVHGPALERARATGEELPEALAADVAQMRADYEEQLDARHAAARGFVDAIVAPEDTRDLLGFLLTVVSRNPGPHLGPFVLDNPG